MNAVLRLVVALVALTAACRPAPEPQRASTDTEASVRQELDQRMATYVRVLMDGDTAGIRALWTADARALGPGMDLSGGAIVSFVNAAFLAGTVITSLNVRPIDTFVHGDAAYELGQVEETVHVPGQNGTTARANYFLRWERASDDMWRIDRFVAGPVAAPNAQ
jgi:hypothetical protein